MTNTGEEMYKVYLVDDDSIILEELESRVPWMENGFEVIGRCTNPVKAIEEVSSLLPDVLICDLRMPEMDGNEMIRRIKEKGLVCEFVMLSAYDEYDDVRTFFKQSGYDYILKPINDEEIRIILEKLYVKISAKLPEEGLQTVTENPTFNELLKYLDEHFAEKLTLEQIAEKFGFSKNYICQLFKKHFDTTFSIYITKKRMTRAKEMLTDKTLSVKEIAFDLGYTDYSHFYRTYKNYYGYSPKENR